MKNLDLKECRDKLDVIDKEIVRLFEERMSVCGDVAEYKIGTGKAVYDAAREAQKIAAVQELAHSEFNKEAVKEIFSQLMSVSRRYQYSLLSAHGMGMDTGFTEVETIGKKNKKIVFQGVEGAYSHAAAKLYFGEDADLYHVPEFEDTMREVEEGRADYAVLPIENSTAGFVINNYDLLLKYKNYIVGEVYVPVAHMLLGVPGAELSDIRTVYSHAQALAQSSDFLSAHKDWKQIAVLNTAVAAKKVMEERGEKINYLVGTMIEVPRAAITASEIAKAAQFFSFGTNDLTQMTFGFSRDDAGKFLPYYYEKKIFESDPFARLDRSGVGKLVEMAVEGGRKTRPDIKLGICGEHGGDPSSVEFCHNIGLAYVSCSPFRVPIAILAAAQANIRNPRG